MTESGTPIDPMADTSLTEDPPREPDAVHAAEQMNDPDGPQPGADNQPSTSDDEPLPEPLP